MTDFNPQSLAQLDRSRFSDYKANLDFYNGEQWTDKMLQAPPARLQLRQDRHRQAHHLPHGRPQLRLRAHRKSNIKYQKSKRLARKAEQVIYQVYAQNNLQELDYETEVDAAILGDGCYKVTWDAEEKRIRVTSPDVNGLYAWWLGDDLSRSGRWLAATR